jgi:hypothetical protein
VTTKKSMAAKPPPAKRNKTTDMAAADGPNVGDSAGTPDAHTGTVPHADETFRAPGDAAAAVADGTAEAAASSGAVVVTRLCSSELPPKPPQAPTKRPILKRPATGSSTSSAATNNAKTQSLEKKRRRVTFDVDEGISTDDETGEESSDDELQDTTQLKRDGARATASTAKDMEPPSAKRCKMTGLAAPNASASSGSAAVPQAATAAGDEAAEAATTTTAVATPTQIYPSEPPTPQAPTKRAMLNRLAKPSPTFSARFMLDATASPLAKKRSRQMVEDDDDAVEDTCNEQHVAHEAAGEGQQQQPSSEMGRAGQAMTARKATGPSPAKRNKVNNMADAGPPEAAAALFEAQHDDAAMSGQRDVSGRLVVWRDDAVDTNHDDIIASNVTTTADTQMGMRHMADDLKDVDKSVVREMNAVFAFLDKHVEQAMEEVNRGEGDTTTTEGEGSSLAIQDSSTITPQTPPPITAAGETAPLDDEREPIAGVNESGATPVAAAVTSADATSSDNAGSAESATDEIVDTTVSGEFMSFIGCGWTSRNFRSSFLPKLLLRNPSKAAANEDSAAAPPTDNTQRHAVEASPPFGAAEGDDNVKEDVSSRSPLDAVAGAAVPNEPADKANIYDDDMVGLEEDIVAAFDADDEQASANAADPIDGCAGWKSVDPREVDDVEGVGAERTATSAAEEMTAGNATALKGDAATVDVTHSANIGFLGPADEAFASSAEPESSDEDDDDDDDDGGFRCRAPFIRRASAPPTSPSYIYPRPVTPTFGPRPTSPYPAAAVAAATTTAAPMYIPGPPPMLQSPTDSTFADETLRDASTLSIPTLSLLRPSPPPGSGQAPPAPVSVPSTPERARHAAPPVYDMSRLVPRVYVPRTRSRCRSPCPSPSRGRYRFLAATTPTSAAADETASLSTSSSSFRIVGNRVFTEDADAYGSADGERGREADDIFDGPGMLFGRRVGCSRTMPPVLEGDSNGCLNLAWRDDCGDADADEADAGNLDDAVEGAQEFQNFLNGM